MFIQVPPVAVFEEAMGMSRRNTRDGKARRRAERERQQRFLASGQEPGTVAVPAIPAVRPDAFGRRNSAARASGPRPDPGDGVIAAERDEADLDASADVDNADPEDFGGLDPDDADLQASLTVMAVLADDLSDIAELAELADDLAGDADGLEVPDEP